jgi:hypothetical protein
MKARSTIQKSRGIWSFHWCSTGSIGGIQSPLAIIFFLSLLWQELRIWTCLKSSDATTAAGYGQGLYSSTRRLTPTLPSPGHRVSLSRDTCLDWTRSTNNVVTTFTRLRASGLLPVGIREIRCLRSFQQSYISYVHGSQMQLHKLMPICLGGDGNK